MGYWIFKCDPKKYRLSNRLAALSDPKISWLVTRYKERIAPGDTAFLMETGPKRAIRAVMAIESSPSLIRELEHEQEFWMERDTEERVRVTGTLTHWGELPIDDLKEIEELQELSIFHGFQQGTNFKVSEAEGRKLVELMERIGA